MVKLSVQPLGFSILRPDFSAMGFHDLAADGESEAGAARIGFGLAALNEDAEHRVQLVLGDAGAVIGDGAAHGLAAVRQVAIGEPDTNSIAATGKTWPHWR